MSVPRNEAVYISPNEAALDSAYQYQPVEKGMGFAVGLFGTLVQAGLALTVATIQTVSTIHAKVEERKQTLQEKHAIERAEAEKAKKDTEAYEDLLKKFQSGTGSTTGGTPAGESVPGSSYIAGGLGISMNTLLIVGAMGVAAILVLKKKS